MQTITLSAKGQLVIPKAMRDQLHLKAGSRLAASLRDGELRLHPLTPPADGKPVVARAGLLHKPGRKKLSAAEEARRIAALIAASR